MLLNLGIWTVCIPAHFANLPFPLWNFSPYCIQCSLYLAKVYACAFMLMTTLWHHHMIMNNIKPPHLILLPFLVFHWSSKFPPFWNLQFYGQHWLYVHLKSKINHCCSRHQEFVYKMAFSAPIVPTKPLNYINAWFLCLRWCDILENECSQQKD